MTLASFIEWRQIIFRIPKNQMQLKNKISAFMLQL